MPSCACVFLAAQNCYLWQCAEHRLIAEETKRHYELLQQFYRINQIVADAALTSLGKSPDLTERLQRLRDANAMLRNNITTLMLLVNAVVPKPVPDEAIPATATPTGEIVLE